MSQDRGSADLPDGWVSNTIADIATVNPRRPAYDGCRDTDEVGFIPMAAVDAGSGTVAKVETRPLGEVRSKSFRTFATDDVLFAKITPCMENGKSAIVPILPNGLGFGSTEFHVLRSKGLVDPQYLWRFVRQETYRKVAEAHMTGSVGQLRVPPEFVRDTVIPVPPLDQQKRILDYLSSVETRRASIADRLVAARDIVDRLRTAVLAAACAGRLTVDWREGSDADWPIMAMADACARVQSGTTPKVWHDGPVGGVPFLKVYNLVEQRLDFDYKPQFIARDLHTGAMRRAEALPGDVLMNIVGPPLGKVAVVTDQFPEWSINQALTLFRPSEHVTTGWLYLFLCSGASPVFRVMKGLVLPAVVRARVV